MECKLTRIAPTPSGFLHLGNVFSFALTAALARMTGASILLRIDDLDRERVQREYLQDIFDTLNFMEIPWDEGPADVAEFEREYSQVHRLGLYRDALMRLRDSGAVYACACSRAEVERARKSGAHQRSDGRANAAGGYPGTCRELGLSLDAAEVSWRLRTDDRVLRVTTLAGGFAGASGDGFGDLVDGFAEASLPVEMRDLVVRKKDGFPAYQLSSVVDDMHYGVDLIVRGQDLWASTLGQHYLSYYLDAADFRAAHFFHHSLLTASGEKLSKSAGATSIRYLRQQGLGPADIYTLIGRSLVSGTTADRFSGDAVGSLGAAHEPTARSGVLVRNWEELAALVDIRASRL